MRLLILGSPDSWYIRDLRRAAGTADQIEAHRFGQLDRWVRGPAGTGPATLAGRWDAVLVRSMPPGSLEQVIFRMDVLMQWSLDGVPVVNPPKSLEAAIDKYLALQRLANAGIPVPQTYACQTAEQALAAFDQMGHDAVVKPLFGSEGRGITRVSDPALAERAFRMLEQLGAVIYLQTFIHHDRQDIRLLVIGDHIWAMRRHNGADWRANVSRGGQSEPFHADQQLRTLAFDCVRCVGAEMAGVDVLIDREGQPNVIEVNAVPGWRALARTLQVDIAKQVLDYLRIRAGVTVHGLEN